MSTFKPYSQFIVVARRDTTIKFYGKKKTRPLKIQKGAKLVVTFVGQSLGNKELICEIGTFAFLKESENMLLEEKVTLNFKQAWIKCDKLYRKKIKKTGYNWAINPKDFKQKEEVIPRIIHRTLTVQYSEDGSLVKWA